VAEVPRRSSRRARHGPYGALVEQLLDVLGKLTLRSGVELVAFVRSQDWGAVDDATRGVCLHTISMTIVRMREKAGLPPFDDDLPPQRITGFLIIRDVMIGI
jgi:hypothetical protein